MFSLTNVDSCAINQFWTRHPNYCEHFWAVQMVSYNIICLVYCSNLSVGLLICYGRKVWIGFRPPFYPSICPLSVTAYPSQGHGGLEPADIDKRQATSWKGLLSITGLTHRDKTDHHSRSHTHLRAILESTISLIKLTCMSLDCGWKPEKTHWHGEIMQTPHTGAQSLAWTQCHSNAAFNQQQQPFLLTPD